jgi:type IV secretory pathway VirB2 component (pilin)
MTPETSLPPANAVALAMRWIESIVTGSLAMSVAVICVGAFGLMLMSGHVPRRRGAQLIIGCFIIFGASAIANGLSAMMFSRSEAPMAVLAAPSLSVRSVPPRTSPPLPPFDPYAGAAVPPRR